MSSRDSTSFLKTLKGGKRQLPSKMQSAVVEKTSASGMAEINSNFQNQC
jgi:hypothetical protein